MNLINPKALVAPPPRPKSRQVRREALRVGAFSFVSNHGQQFRWPRRNRRAFARTAAHYGHDFSLLNKE